MINLIDSRFEKKEKIEAIIKMLRRGSEPVKMKAVEMINEIDLDYDILKLIVSLSDVKWYALYNKKKNLRKACSDTIDSFYKKVR